MTNILEKIESLRSNKTPDEIENILLNKELGEIGTRLDGYQYIGNFLLSWLVVEAHEPEFFEYMWAHPKEYVVHHIDGNRLNNIYLNLQVMSRSEHTKMHDDEWYKDPVNAESEKVRCEKISNSAAAYFADPSNAEVIKAVGKTISETKRKNNGWVTPKNNSEFFKSPFTVKDYAGVSEISLETAGQRLRSLFRSKEVVCKKELIESAWCNVYRRL